MDFKERKQERKEHYEQNVKGWKQRVCSACSGSGYYDSFNSPKCGACNGTGKERYKPERGVTK
jgi:DnaJ-class molecular chaperone